MEKINKYIAAFSGANKMVNLNVKKKTTECGARRRHSKGTSYLVHLAELLPVSRKRLS